MDVRRVRRQDVLDEMSSPWTDPKTAASGGDITGAWSRWNWEDQGGRPPGFECLHLRVLLFCSAGTPYGRMYVLFLFMPREKKSRYLCTNVQCCIHLSERVLHPIYHGMILFRAFCTIMLLPCHRCLSYGGCAFHMFLYYIDIYIYIYFRFSAPPGTRS